MMLIKLGQLVYKISLAYFDHPHAQQIILAYQSHTQGRTLKKMLISSF